MVFKDEAAPIKCLDLNDTSGQLKLEDWLYIVSIFIPFALRRPNFAGNMGDNI